MKIFNWVTKKLYQNADGYIASPKKDDFSYHVNKTETVTTEADTKALLEYVNLVDVWKDGILTIGTFGFDQPQDECSIEKEEQEEEVEEEEDQSITATKKQSSPLVANASPKLEMVLLGLKPDTTVVNPDITVNVEETPDTLPLLQLVESTNERKRVTLADLLATTEVDVVKMPNAVKVPKESSKKKSAGSEKKGVLSFGKKPKDENSRLKRKLQKMISKMLKKKIYPDLEGKDGLDDQLKETTDSTVSEHCHSSNDGRRIEMVSFLQGAVSQS
ncbi:Tac1 [Thalictrum thalictroides]|uniref:Protein TILLER ANGLE CONTROL 1 n=1 Tax=Thalictrum thalictroides TaxID=46969 RepID=A0A7J6VHJ5_THATH|nr:Tac1 [Thalictrum thalictroides]